jgi:hypothetical protein
MHRFQRKGVGHHPESVSWGGAHVDFAKVINTVAAVLEKHGLGNRYAEIKKSI